MKRLFLVLGTAAVIIPSLAGARVQADLIQWSASGTPLGPNLSVVPSVQILPQNGVDAVINLLPGSTTSGTNSGSVAALAVSYALDPDATGSPIFGGSSANYSLSLALHDDASGASGSLIFRGNLSGTVLPGGGGYLNFKNTFLGPTTQTLQLGQDLYTVTIGPFVPPPFSSFSPPLDWEGGTISATISAQPLTNSTPEPSSLLLVCLGLPSLGLAGWFRRRKAGKVGRILETHATSSA